MSEAAVAHRIENNGEMETELESDVCVIGAGPVGATAAMLLARSGCRVIVVESRLSSQTRNAKSNHVSVRTMEIFRRLGVAQRVREAGLPEDFPNDVIFATHLTGVEIKRFAMPSRRDRFNDGGGEYVDGGQPSAERAVRLSQMYLEPILLDHAMKMDNIRVIDGTNFESYSQDADGVVVNALTVGDNRPIRIKCKYLIGADGARSMVRKQIGATLSGLDNLVRARSALIRSPDLLKRFSFRPGWMSWFPIGSAWAAVLAIDGRETWLCHWHYFPDDPAYETFDLDQGLRDVLGDGEKLDYEIVARDNWAGKRLTADRVQDGRVFLCGDSAHQWVPFAGYGMNAGIADAHDLAWMLSAVLQGWAPPSLPDNYAIERMPVTHQVSGFTTRFVDVLRDINAEDLGKDDATGREVRRKVGEQIHMANIAAIVPNGLNYGYCYADSPIIAHDGEQAPPFTMGDYQPSLVPGCRLPHFYLGDGRSLYDVLGEGFTLIRFDPGIDVSPLLDAAECAGVPLQLLDVDETASADPQVYDMPLVLARPDQHIAWRGANVPGDPAALINIVRGGVMSSAPRMAAA